MFYDNTKSKEENDKDKNRYSHNKEFLQYVTSGFAVVTAALSLALIAKKAKDEFF